MPEPTFRVAVLTEQGLQYRSEAVSVVAPGELGYLGILAHHAPLLTTLVPGRLTLRTPQQTTERFLLGPGLLEIFHNQVTILTEQLQSAETRHAA